MTDYVTALVAVRIEIFKGSYSNFSKPVTALVAVRIEMSDGVMVASVGLRHRPCGGED